MRVNRKIASRNDFHRCLEGRYVDIADTDVLVCKLENDMFGRRVLDLVRANRKMIFSGLNVLIRFFILSANGKTGIHAPRLEVQLLNIIYVAVIDQILSSSGGGQ